MFNRILPALVCGVVLLSAACGDDATPAPSPSPASLNPANATYVIDGKSITLSSGKADAAAAPGSASRNVTTLTQFTASGDIDGDGKNDTAVILTNSGGGSGTFYYVAVLLGSTNAATNTLLLGDRISVTQVAIKSGAIVVDYLDRPSSAPMSAEPSVPTEKNLVVVGGQLKGK